MADSDSGLQERMVALVRAFGLHQTDRTPCGQPVPVSAAHALMELERGDPLSQTELASRLQLEKSTVSRLVRDLEQRGWVARERDRQDARVLLLGLTEQGRGVAAQLAAARADRYRRIFQFIPPDERERVLHSLSRLTEAMAKEGIVKEDTE